MTPLKVAIIADLLEERWPSMDLVADMLVEHLRAEYAGTGRADAHPSAAARARVEASSRGHAPPALTIDRFANRLWDYPRATRGVSGRFDLFHIVDHSYAHLVHTLPAERTLVTCHDLDTFRSILEPELEPRPALFRAMTRRILAGLRAAGHVACDTEATRDALVARAGVDPARTSVVLNGPHPSCSPEAEPAADVEAARLLGHASRTIDLLHVSSTIARKRIDVLLTIVAAVRKQRPDVRLVRVGGPFTAEQRRLARDLGHRATRSSCCRSSIGRRWRPSTGGARSCSCRPSAKGSACRCSRRWPAARRSSRATSTRCARSAATPWSTARRRTSRPGRAPSCGCCPSGATIRHGWRARRTAGIERAASFSWSRYTADVVALYLRLAAAVPETVAAR